MRHLIKKCPERSVQGTFIEISSYFPTQKRSKMRATMSSRAVRPVSSPRAVVYAFTSSSSFESSWILRFSYDSTCIIKHTSRSALISKLPVSMFSSISRMRSSNSSMLPPCLFGQRSIALRMLSSRNLFDSYKLHSPAATPTITSERSFSRLSRLARREARTSAFIWVSPEDMSI